jgi:hypothetical protein
MTFLPGRSGNPAGRPRGSRNKRTILAEQILHDRAADVTQAAVDLAVRGNGPALRMCLDRIAPPMRHRLLDFDLPALATADDAVAAANAIVQGAAHGELTVHEAGALMKLVRTFTLVLAAADRAKRNAPVEVRHAGDVGRLPDRETVRDDHIDDEMAIAAQGAPHRASAAAKADVTAQPPIQDTIQDTTHDTSPHTVRQTKTAALACPRPRAPARAGAPATALGTPPDRRPDVDETFAQVLAEGMASLRTVGIRDGAARHDPSRSGDRAAAA